MTSVVISQPMLFPWPGFFEQLMLADTYVYLDDAQFSKGSFTNRIRLKHGDGTRWMTIPLAGGGTFQTIAALGAAEGPWRQAHRDLLAQSLAAAPFRDDALAILDRVYQHDQLCDLLIASIEEPARYLGVAPRQLVTRTSAIGVDGRSWQRVLDIVRHCGGTRYLTGHGASKYLSHETFESSGVAVDYMQYSCTPWPQCTANFSPYVSVLDLIGHTGPRAATYLKPATTPWRDFIASQGAAR